VFNTTTDFSGITAGPSHPGLKERFYARTAAHGLPKALPNFLAHRALLKLLLHDLVACVVDLYLISVTNPLLSKPVRRDTIRASSADIDRISIKS
jgi:hypothetical protein